MAKSDSKTIERTYNVPLRKEYMKAPKWRRTKKAVAALRQFLAKHMKSDDVKISAELNEKLWKHGIKNPPHHVKVSVTKDEAGVVKADLFDKKVTSSSDKKESKKVKNEKKAVKKEAKQA